MRRALYLLIPAAFILAVIAPGCYTIVMHPSDEGRYHTDQTSDCVGCHVDFDEYPYGYYYSPHPNYWWDYDNYAYYYAYPWWWGYYDYPYVTGEYDYEGQSGRDTKFNRREVPQGPAPPPYSGPFPELDPYPTPPHSPPTYPNPDQDYDPSTGRTQPDGGTVDGTGSRSKDENSDSSSGKDSQPSTPSRPKPSKDGNVTQDNSSNDNTKPDKPKESKDKKKTRRGGGGK
jgi:hypothetical protein